MEYFIGSATTIVILYALFRVLQKHKKDAESFVIRYTQSSVFEIIRPFIPVNLNIIPIPLTQAMKDIERNTMRILYFENKAYWIENNQLFEADAPFGDIDKESMIQVDTMAMDAVQLKRTMFIVEKLREGLNNDLGYSGDTPI